MLLKSIDPLDIMFCIISVILLLNPIDPGWFELSIHADKSSEPLLTFPPLTLFGATATFALLPVGPPEAPLRENFKSPCCHAKRLAMLSLLFPNKFSKSSTVNSWFGTNDI